MNKKLQIVQEMGELAKSIKKMESDLVTIKRENIKFLDEIKIRYATPIPGNATRKKTDDITFPILNEESADKIISCIRQVYEENLTKCYDLMDEYAEKLKNAI